MFNNMNKKIYSSENGFINGKLRKAAVLFVSLIMVLSLAACGADTAEGAASNSGDGKIIHVCIGSEPFLYFRPHLSSCQRTDHSGGN